MDEHWAERCTGIVIGAAFQRAKLAVANSNDSDPSFFFFFSIASEETSDSKRHHIDEKDLALPLNSVMVPFNILSGPSGKASSCHGHGCRACCF